MKTFVVTFLLLSSIFANSPAHALEMVCKSYNTFSGEDYEDPNNHLLIGSINEYTCKTAHGQGMIVSLYGVGPGIRADLGDLLTVNCPLIREKKVLRLLEKHNAFTLFGADASLAAGVSARLGFFVNHRGGICTLTGTGIALGASAQISALSISEPECGGQSQRSKRVRSGRFSVERLFTW